MLDMRDFISLIATLTSWDARVFPDSVMPVLVAAIVESEFVVVIELESVILDVLILLFPGSGGKSDSCSMTILGATFEA